MIELTITCEGKSGDVYYSTSELQWDAAKADYLCNMDYKVSNATFHHPEEWDTCEDEVECWTATYVGEGNWELTGAHCVTGPREYDEWDHECEPRTITTAQLRTILKDADKETCQN